MKKSSSQAQKQARVGRHQTCRVWEMICIGGLAGSVRMNEIFEVYVRSTSNRVLARTHG